MTDATTLPARLAALRRMIANGEHKSDLLAALDRIDALAKVEPVAAADDSDPPEGYKVHAERGYLWRASRADDDWFTWSDHRTRAVAACWAAYREAIAARDGKGAK